MKAPVPEQILEKKNSQEIVDQKGVRTSVKKVLSIGQNSWKISILIGRLNLFSAVKNVITIAENQPQSKP
jgi:hypothetical protein